MDKSHQRMLHELLYREEEPDSDDDDNANDGPANGGSGPQQFYAPPGYPPPHFHPHGPPPPAPRRLPASPPHAHSQHSHSSHIYHRDERAQRQHGKLKRKLEQKQAFSQGARGDASGFNSGYSTPALSPRKEFVNGGRGPGSTMGGTSSEGEGSSSAATSVQGDEDESQPLLDLLSSLQTPVVSDVTARSALVQWSAPVSDAPPPPFSGELCYELLLGEKSRYKAIYSGSSLSCRVQDLRPGTEYTVCLQAHAEGLTGAASGTAILRTPPCEPAAPASPRAATRTRTTLQLRWLPPADNGSHIQHYVLQYDEGKGGPFVDLCKPRIKHHTLSKLEGSTRYRFRVAAANDVGLGPWSEEVAYWTCGSPPAQPGPPVLLRAASTGLHLCWERRPGDEEFTLQFEDEHIRRGYLLAYSGRDTEHLCEGLVRYSDYKFRLQAHNEEGGSRWSDEVVFRTLPECPAAPPKPFVKGKIHAQFFRIRWVPPLNYGGAEIQFYVLEIKSGAEYEVVYRGPDLEATCDKLQPATTYRVRVCCTTAGGTGDWSEPQTVTTEPVPPGSPCAPALLGEPRPHSLSLRWQKPDCDGGSPILEYNVEMTDDEKSGLVYNGKETECTVQELLPGRRYDFKVKAFNRIGAGPWSERTTVTSGAAPPDPPEPPRVSVKSPSSVSLQWDEPPSNGGPIVDYNLEMKLTGDEDDPFASVYREAQPTTDIKSLTPFTTYSFRVCASNRAGNGDWSETVEASTPGAPPGAPPTVDAVATAGDIVLNWTEPPANGASISHYRIDVGEKVHTTDGPVLEYRLDNLPSETAYRVRIQAVNDIGIGNFSPTLKISTLPPPPEAPQLSMAQQGHNFLKLKWGDGKNPDFTRYIVEMQNPRRKEYHVVYQGTSMSFRVKKLQESTAYRFRICASNDAGGQGEFSDDVELETCAAPPATLKAPRVVEQRDDAALVEWSPPRQLPDEPLIYVVQCCRAKDQEYRQVYKGPEMTATVEDLEGGCEYWVRLCAERVVGGTELQGAWSPVLVLQPPPAPVAAAPPVAAPLAPRRAPRRSAAQAAMSDNHYALLLLGGFVLVAIIAAIAVESFINWRSAV